MNIEIKYQGRYATYQDVEFINRLIADNPGDSRRALSQKVCRAWNWTQANGELRDMICRGFMLRLESAGYIKLPPRKKTPNNPLANRRKPKKILIAETPIYSSLSQIHPLEIRQVRRSSLEKLYNSLIDQYHYLGYCHCVGEHLKYIVFYDDRPIACLSWSSAVRHIGCRDRFIGWSADVRKKNLKFLAYNGRFLILPWIQIKFLASHLLSRLIKIIPKDWERIYNHPIYYLETFVDQSQFKGTSYYASNWHYIGNTTGRWELSKTKTAGSIKAVMGYPLSKKFRELLNHV